MTRSAPLPHPCHRSRASTPVGRGYSFTTGALGPLVGLFGSGADGDGRSRRGRVGSDALDEVPHASSGDVLDCVAQRRDVEHCEDHKDPEQ